jgi:hypothetical protein
VSVNGGALTISADWDGRRLTRIDLAVKRPRADLLLVGRKPAEVLDWVPRLYSLCGRAQSLAARMALASAQGQPLNPEPIAMRLLLAEQAQEHLWRLLRDWPTQISVTPRNNEFAGWFRRLGTMDEGAPKELLEYFETTILGRPWTEWSAMSSMEDIVRWARDVPAYAGQLSAALLPLERYSARTNCLTPTLTAADFAAIPWTDNFSRKPEWHGAAAETGAYAHWAAQPLIAAAGNGLLGRFLARLLDLGATIQQLVQRDAGTLADACAPARNEGLARVDTARGTLLHRVEIVDDRVAQYAVVAPTEWNFHPRGACAAALADLEEADESVLRSRIGCWVTAFDPCVAWNLELHRA